MDQLVKKEAHPKLSSPTKDSIIITYVGVIRFCFSCSPSSNDQIKGFNFVLHQQIYDQTSTKTRLKSHTSCDVVMLVVSTCLLFL